MTVATFAFTKSTVSSVIGMYYKRDVKVISIVECIEGIANKKDQGRFTLGSVGEGLIMADVPAAKINKILGALRAKALRVARDL